MADSHIHACEVIELVLVCSLGLSSCEIVCYVWEMEEDCDGVNQDYRSDPSCYGGCFEEVSADDRSVGMGSQNELLIFAKMFSHYEVYLVAHLLSRCC